MTSYSSGVSSESLFNIEEGIESFPILHNEAAIKKVYLSL